MATGYGDDSKKPGEVTFWDAATAAPRGVMRGFKNKVASLAVASDGRTIAAGSSDGIQLWDVASASVVAVLNTRKGDPLAIRNLSGTIKAAKGGKTTLVFASDFRMPTLRRPE